MPTNKAFGNEQEIELQYITLLKKCLSEGYIGTNNRTKSPVKFLIGERIAINDSDILPLFFSRRLFLKTAAAELAWTISGSKSPDFIQFYTKIWEKFIVDNEIQSAYGYRWRNHFDRDQLQECIQSLKKDSSTRQAVVMAWDPMNDGLLNIGNMANVPCPIGFQASIAGNMLHLHVFQRSADLVLGLPYDMLMYSMLNCAMAKSLNILPGKTIFSITNAHIYGYLEETAQKQIIIYDEYIKQNIKKHSYTIPEIEWIDMNRNQFVLLMQEQEKQKYQWKWQSPRLEPIA